MARSSDTEERSKRLREARLATGLNHEQVVARTGISRSTISRHENGSPIPWDAAEKYAALYGTEPEDFAEVLSPSFARRLETIEWMVASLVARDLSDLALEPGAASGDRLGAVEAMEGAMPVLRARLAELERLQAEREAS